MISVLMVLSAATHWTLADDSRHPTGVWAEAVSYTHLTLPTILLV